MTTRRRHRLARLLAVAAAQLCSVADAAPTVIVTVDVESTEGVTLPAQAAAVCTDGRPCGLQRIAAMLKEQDLAATFFLDVYEYKAWGEPALRGIAQQLGAAGQDVALHSHPHWAYDPRRVYMYEYSTTEQERIIRDGAALLADWTGRPVVSHRAGAYSANADTLEALARNNIANDSSLYLGHPHSRLNGLGLPSNVPSRVATVDEIPVTVYRREEKPRLLSESAPAYVSIRKFDVNSFVDEHEAKDAIAAAIHAGLPIIVVFLHSYSFIDKPTSSGGLVANRRAERVLSAVLRETTRSGLRFATMRDLAAARDVVRLNATDTIPTVPVVVATHRYAAHWLRAHISGRAVVVAIVLLALAAAFFAGRALIAARRRHRRARAPLAAAPRE